MSISLGRFLESIDPDHALDEVAARADEAINSFAMDAAVVHGRSEFTSLMGEFYGHVLATVLRMSRPHDLSLSMCWGKCSKVLQRLYGRSGEKTAFELARTGPERGLSGVLRDVAEEVAEECVANEITARTSHYWHDLSVEERLAASSQYLQNYGHLLPSELTEGSAARVRAEFPRVLRHHPALIRRLRQVGR